MSRLIRSPPQFINRWQQIAPIQAWEYKWQCRNLLLPALSGNFWFFFVRAKHGQKSFCFHNDRSQTKLPQRTVSAVHRGTTSFQGRALALCAHTESRKRPLEVNTQERDHIFAGQGTIHAQL